jgi:hypothetical protein
LGVLPNEPLARLMPLGSNFRLNIDFARARKKLSGKNFSYRLDGRQNLPRRAKNA